MIRDFEERGAALLSTLVLITAMSVAALMATTAIARQTEMVKAARARADAGWAVYSAEAIARSGVSEWIGLANDQAAYLSANLNAPLTVPIKGGFVTMVMSDATNCFNLNSLANEDEGAAKLAHTAWVRLLSDLDIPQSESEALANTLTDWLDSDSSPRPGGAEDSYYLTLSPSYRAANQLMDSPRELAAVMGYTPTLTEALKPLTCALPKASMLKLNLNTLTPQQAPLLRAVYSNALSLAAAERIIMERPDTGWPDVEAFEALPDIRTIPPGEKRTEALGTQSSFFQADGRVNLEGGSWSFSFLISTEDQKEIRTLWRRMGEE